MHAIVGTGGGTGEGHGVRDCDRAREGERKLERGREGVVEGRETDTGGGAVSLSLFSPQASVH